MKKINGCKNNPENSSTAKVGEHKPSGFLMSAILPHLKAQKISIMCTEVKNAQ